MNASGRIAVVCLTWCALGLAPIALTAPPPKSGSATSVAVTSATPATAYQSTTIDVLVGGSGFDSTASAKYLVSGSDSDTGGITVVRTRYVSSTQLATTIAVAKNADLSNFDIVVTLSDGRKGKGTTLFKVQAPPTYPAARAWHSFASNGGSQVASPRLYMYGGSGSDWQAVPADLWFYAASAHRWTLVTPTSTTKPGQRQHAGLSCGSGACVLAWGNNGFNLVDETWVYGEATNAWTQVACSRRAPCPSPRQMVTMAFDPVRGNHLLFGGRGATSGLNDTLTFDAATLKWTVRSPAYVPSERNRAAARYVPGVGVVMHGGQPWSAQTAFCDMYAWNGSDWARVTFDLTQPHPCLHSHDMAWDGVGLVLTGGYVDTSDTPSTTNWRFTFAPDGRSGAWSQVSIGTCQPIDGTDGVIHPGARMAHDAQAATRVYFGGEMNGPNGAIRYGNTVECY